MEGVVKQVLASVQADLYDNLPLEEDFIIRLQNEHLINNRAATKLRPLARNGDQSCIQDLITYMRNFFDEATLNKFCTFLDKYGRDGQPLMVTLAAKISAELKARKGSPANGNTPSSVSKRQPSDSGQIISICDLLPFLESMLPHLGRLGPALGIPDYATAIIDGPKSNPDKCQDILQYWLACTPAATLDLLCEKLSEVQCFARVVAKMQEAQQ